MQLAHLLYLLSMMPRFVLSCAGGQVCFSADGSHLSPTALLLCQYNTSNGSMG